MFALLDRSVLLPSLLASLLAGPALTQRQPPDDPAIAEAIEDEIWRDDSIAGRLVSVACSPGPNATSAKSSPRASPA